MERRKHYEIRSYRKLYALLLLSNVELPGKYVAGAIDGAILRRNLTGDDHACG